MFTPPTVEKDIEVAQLTHTLRRLPSTDPEHIKAAGRLKVLAVEYHWNKERFQQDMASHQAFYTERHEGTKGDTDE